MNNTETRITLIDEATLFFKHGHDASGNETTAVCGMVQFPNSKFINESDVYTLNLRNKLGNFSQVVTYEGIRIDDKFIKDYAAYHVDDLMSLPVWNKTESDGLTTVRFIKAFPGSNQWAIYGVTSTSPFEVGTLNVPHDDYWVKISGGERKLIDPPVWTEGTSLAGVMREPIWVNAGDGQPYTIEPSVSRMWPTFDILHEVTGDVGDGKISVSEAVSRLSAESEFAEIVEVSTDPTYQRYVAGLRRHGIMQPTGPEPKSVIDALPLVSEKILQEMRAVEENSLAPSRSGPSMRH